MTWDTDIVANFRERMISIRLDRTYSEDALVLNGKFSTPHFITLLINSGYLKDDVDIPVVRDSIPVTDRDAAWLEKVFDGTMPYMLPIVYVAKSDTNDDPVSVSWLASRLNHSEDSQ